MSQEIEQDTLSVTILGASGFLGARLAAQLLADGTLAPPPDSNATHLVDPFLMKPIGRLVLFDAREPVVGELRNPLGIEVVTLSGDVSDEMDVIKAIPWGTNVVVHLAAIVSGQAEADYELGVKVNTKGTEAVANVLRRRKEERGGRAGRIVFTSSVASFSVTSEQLLSETQGFLDDSSAQRPLNSYGAQKAMAELLLSDMSRRGMLDAVNVRLPTISVRPGLPNAAASGFLSGIIREPLLGLHANCPVPREELESTKVWLASPSSAVEWLRWACVVSTGSSDQMKGKWGASRSVTPPGCSVSISQMLSALESANPEALELVTFNPDEKIMSIVKSWPPGFRVERGLELGFREGGGIEGIVREFLDVGIEETRRVRGMS